MTIDAGDSLRIKNIRGYFLMLKGQQPTTTFKMLILNNIHLVRYACSKTGDNTTN